VCPFTPCYERQTEKIEKRASKNAPCSMLRALGILSTLQAEKNRNQRSPRMAKIVPCKMKNAAKKLWPLGFKPGSPDSK
jgi:hypothetical protein